MASSPSLVAQAELTFDCCGLGVDEKDDIYTKPTAEDMAWTNTHGVFDNHPTAQCYHEKNSTAVPDKCYTCYSLISDKVRALSYIGCRLYLTIMSTCLTFL